MLYMTCRIPAAHTSYLKSVMTGKYEPFWNRVYSKPAVHLETDPRLVYINISKACWYCSMINSMIKCKKPYITDPECMEHLSWGGAEGSKDLLTCAHCLPSEWGQERPHWVMSTKPHRDTSTLNPAYHEASLGTKTRFVSLPPPPYNLHLGRSLLEPPARWTCLNF